MKTSISVIITVSFIAIFTSIWGGFVSVCILHPQPYKLYELNPVPRPGSVELSMEAEDIAWNSIDLKLSNRSPNHAKIENYAVNEKGQIAVLSLHYILVYNKDGSFACSFSHDVYGQEYVDWEGDNVVLIRTRSNTAIHFDLDGNLQKIQDLGDDHSAINRYTRYLFSAKKKQGDITYEDRKTSIISDKLVAIDNEGNEQLIYQTSALYTVYNILFVLFMLAFPVLVCYKIISYTIDLNEGGIEYKKYIWQKNIFAKLDTH